MHAGFRPWGPWATTAIAALIGTAFVGAQTAIGAAIVVMTAPALSEADMLRALDGLAGDGNFITWATLGAAPFCAALTVGAARLRGANWRGYLALKPLYLSPWLRWLLAMALYGALCDAVTALLGRPLVSPFAAAAYESAGSKLLLIAAFVGAAPLFEELFFRGFLFRGLEKSPLGGRGAVVVTALAFSALHLQYDAWGLLQVLGAGLLLGAARLRTGSLYAAVPMHMLLNAAATLQAALI